jgi:hypothetical protein
VRLTSTYQTYTHLPRQDQIIRMSFNKFVARLSLKKERKDTVSTSTVSRRVGGPRGNIGDLTISSPRLRRSSVSLPAPLVEEEQEQEEDPESRASTPISFVPPLPSDAKRQQEEEEEEDHGGSSSTPSARPRRPTLDFGSRPALSSLSQSLGCLAEARVWKDRCESFRCQNGELAKANAGLRVEVGRLGLLEDEMMKLETQNARLRALVKSMRKVIGENEVEGDCSIVER